MTAVITSEASIIIGNAKKVGPRATDEPDKNSAAMTPRVATDMTTGNTRTSGPGDGNDGNSGGAATTISVATNAGGRRGVVTLPTVGRR
ncbi:hypothetical protein MLAC_33940 [Mycobacterium lacus]|uniref:Uncharacterized protein n=1 Tax=Mycobacterium lacus TaxID=169765 RepID=A0A7I7NNK1_9MYCO|nr:hypothetical protein MLAC_33940 [Mycobacterium lacus]